MYNEWLSTVGVHKSRKPDSRCSYILHDGVYYLLVLCMEPVSCPHSGAYKYETAPVFFKEFLHPLLHSVVRKEIMYERESLVRVAAVHLSSQPFASTTNYVLRSWHVEQTYAERRVIT